jgi:NADPH2:quinone reductase
MPHAIQVSETGGPEVLRWVDAPAATPGSGQIRIKQKAIGLNFIDVYYRKGVYPPAGGFPFTPGGEGAGVVDAVGDGVRDFKPGDRVVYQVALGGYTESRLLDASRAVKLPDEIDFKTAAAVFLKGLTAACLLRRTYKVESGTTILFHAAAGGVGSIACQWAAALGATVIGTVGSDDKMKVASRNGCAHVINYRKEDFVARVKEITGGKGVDVVYDSVGKDTFPGSLDCLRPLGLWAVFGQSSGLLPEFPINLLQQKGSLFATRMSVLVYLAKRPDLEAAAHELFDVIRAGKVNVEIGQEFPLSKAAEAHKALEARKTVGPTVLIP